MRTMCDHKFKLFLLLGMVSLMAGCANESSLVSDFCPDDAEKTAPGACGCGVRDADADQDGTPDCHDGCPNDVNKIVPGICGCGENDALDANSNQIPDCIEENVDLCPDDKDKTQPGLCGCGVSDDDSDKDGVPDCFDQCPDDPKKTLEGVCGCGIEDSLENLSDNDGDGRVNCIDPCSDNPDLDCKLQDIDGDGFSDDVDTCPYNPHVHEAKDDCNYVTQPDGKRVFEVWSAHDLDRLRGELQKRIPDGRVGMTCHKAGIVSCQNAGHSPDYYTCMMDPGVQYVGRIAKESCFINETCTQNAQGVFSCSESSCRSTENPSKNGDCCDEQSFPEQCSADGQNLIFCIETYVAVEACKFGCTTDSDGGVNCNNSCIGETKFEGGDVNDCCDENQYVSTCREDGSLLMCNHGYVEVRACPTGCVADDNTPQATCASCLDNAVDDIGACCDPYTYQTMCSDASTLKKCDNAGYVVKETCTDGCFTNADGSASRCENFGLSDDLFEVRIMKDIDLADVLERQHVGKRCGGLWESLPLYRVHFDGNGKTIRFADPERCSMVAPFFSEVVESSVEALNLDFDMAGAAPAALTVTAVDSVFRNLEWRGQWDKSDAFLGEQGFVISEKNVAAVFAASADHCLVDHAHYAGSIDANHSFFGFFGQISNSVLTNLHATPERFACRQGTCYAAFENIVLSVVKELEMDMDFVSAGSRWGIMGNVEGDLDTVKIHIADLVLSDAKTNMPQIYLTASEEIERLYHLELDVDHIDAVGANVYVFNRVKEQGSSGDWRAFLKDWQIHLGDITTTQFAGGRPWQVFSDLQFTLDTLHLVPAENLEKVPSFNGVVDLSDGKVSLQHANINLGSIKGLDERPGVQEPKHATCSLVFDDVWYAEDITVTVEDARCGELYGFAKRIEQGELIHVNFEAKNLLAVSNIYLVNEMLTGGALIESAFYTEKVVGEHVDLIHNMAGGSLVDVAFYGNYYSTYQDIPEKADTFTFSNGLVTQIKNTSGIQNVVATSHFYRFTERNSHFEPKDAVVSYDFPMMYGYYTNKSDYRIPLMSEDKSNRYYLKENEKATATKLEQLEEDFTPYSYSDVTQIIQDLGGEAAGWITKTVAGKTIPWRSFDTSSH